MRKRKAKNGAKNEEWAASVVLDQLMGDVMAVKAYLATNPPAPAEFEASSGASGSKGKTSKYVFPPLPFFSPVSYYPPFFVGLSVESPAVS